MKEVLKVCGLTKDIILRRLAPFEDQPIEIEVEENCLDAKITLSSQADGEFDALKSKVYRAFEQEVYSPFDKSLAETASELLKRNGRVLAVGESLTGGAICSMLTAVPGISRNFYEGIVCYNRGSKEGRLGVSPATLDDYGAISRQTASEMVRGLNIPPVDIALATTGLAGPDGDEGKPVGLVYIGVGSGEFITCFEKRLEGDRQTIRMSTANLALYYLIKYLRGEIFALV